MDRSSPHGWRLFLRDVFLPAVLFGGVYFGIFLLLGVGAGVAYQLLLPGQDPTPVYETVALIAALAASILVIRIREHGLWHLGLVVSPRRFAAHCLGGAALAVAIIGAADFAIVETSTLEHVPGPGIDWLQVLFVFVPAAMNEEIVFRGYVFQKVAAWNTRVAVLGLSAIFAAVHLSNPSISMIGIGNIFLAGVLLSLAYLVVRSLWLPISLHIVWNVLSGPVLGHEVSGLQFQRTLMLARDRGPVYLTGGSFGIEGSIWTSWFITLAVLALLWSIRHRDAVVIETASSDAAVETPPDSVPQELQITHDLENE